VNLDQLQGVRRPAPERDYRPSFGRDHQSAPERDPGRRP
jgi:hypothetical protein